MRVQNAILFDLRSLRAIGGRPGFRRAGVCPTPHPVPLPVEGRGGSSFAAGEVQGPLRLPTSGCRTIRAADADQRFCASPNVPRDSLSPQRGEGRGEGWESVSVSDSRHRNVFRIDGIPVHLGRNLGRNLGRPLPSSTKLATKMPAKEQSNCERPDRCRHAGGTKGWC
jgi:hypothetical protein